MSDHKKIMAPITAEFDGGDTLEMKGAFRKVCEEADGLAERIIELEAMLLAGNLCEYQIVLKAGNDVDLMLRSREPGYEWASLDVDGVEKDLSNCLPVLIADEDGLSIWRFYRKAGH